MISRRLIAALTAVLSLSACSVIKAPAAVPSPPPPVDPKVRLSESVAGLRAGNYAYDVEMPEARGDGVMNLAAKAAAWHTEDTAGNTTVVDTRLIGTDEYVLTSKDAPDKRWLHLDVARETFGNPDITFANQLLASIRTATATGSTIQGKLDTKQLTITSRSTLYLIRWRITGIMSYTVTLDEQGRLTKFDLAIPARKNPFDRAGDWVLTITGYGTTPAPGRPSPTKESRV